jgi:leucyl-tRNA synthetase
MTYVNYLSEMEKIPATMYETLLKLMSPFTPHLAEEMWARLGHQTLIVTETWPKGDAKLAEDNVITLAVQLNGKMRGTISIAKDADKSVAEAEALKLENVARQIEGKTIKKIIVVPNRIVNIVA